MSFILMLKPEKNEETIREKKIIIFYLAQFLSNKQNGPMLKKTEIEDILRKN